MQRKASRHFFAKSILRFQDRARAGAEQQGVGHGSGARQPVAGIDVVRRVARRVDADQNQLADAATWNAWAITMMILASIALVLLLVNNVFGAACDVRIQTAVQTDILTPLSRVKRANQALERLRPLINQAQGQFTAEEAVLRLRELTAPTITTPRTASPTQQVDL